MTPPTFGQRAECACGEKLVETADGLVELRSGMQHNCPNAAEHPGSLEITLGDASATLRTARAGPLQRTSWHFDDPDRYLVEGALGDPPPSVFRRDDGIALLYSGQVNALYGESGSMKSFIAQAACAQCLQGGEAVIVYDFEANGGQWHERIRALGVPDGTLRGGFRYVRPSDPLDRRGGEDLEADLRAISPALVVIDGVTDAMTLHGFDPNSNKEYAAFDRLLPKFVASLGPAVLLIDHVGHASQSRAFGAQHKRASITGASYQVKMIEPFGRGRTGRAALTLSKDRGGYLQALGPNVAEVVLQSDVASGAISWSVCTPTRAAANHSGFRPTTLMERTSRIVEERPDLGTNEILSATGGKKDAARLALRTLVSEGFVETREGSRGKVLHTCVRPYRQANDGELDPTGSQPGPGLGRHWDTGSPTFRWGPGPGRSRRIASCLRAPKGGNGGVPSVRCFTACGPTPPLVRSLWVATCLQLCVKSQCELPKMASLHEQWVRCGRAGCHCQSGVLHGPYLARFERVGGRLTKRYVKVADRCEALQEQAEAKALVAQRRRETKQAMEIWRRLRTELRESEHAG